MGFSKPCLVIYGYKQEHDIHYDETFAPVGKMTTGQTLLAFVVVRGWPLWQMDVNNALHGDLQESIFMKPPTRYAHPPSHICHMCKSLYGLKQAPCAWFDKFQSAIIKFGF